MIEHPAAGLYTCVAEEVGHDVGLTQYHMTLECSLEHFWSVAGLVTGAQPAMGSEECTVFSHWCSYK